MSKPRSTLLTSPLSMADFAFRLAFFAVAPFAVVVLATLFPVRGALIDVGLALVVFASGEALSRFTRRSRLGRVLLAQAFEFENYYRDRKPRKFAYYVFYPLLFPYWLSVPHARREFLVFRSYTLGGLLLLVGSLVFQFFSDWRPQLSVTDYLPFVLLSLLMETLLVLSLLMPIATTVVWYHSSLRRGRLMVLLLVGLASTATALSHVLGRRNPVVSYATRERVRLRTMQAPSEAHRVLGSAAMAGLTAARAGITVDTNGIVLGAPVEQARDLLQSFYKRDEAYAFELWVDQAHMAQVIVIYFQAEPHKRPIWLGLRRDGTEIQTTSELPRGASRAMRRAEGDDRELWTWPQQVLSEGLLGDERSSAKRRPRAAESQSLLPASSE